MRGPGSCLLSLSAPPECLVLVSQVSCVTRSPVHLLFNTQVTVSTSTQTLSFNMKESGKEGRNMVRDVCGLLPQPLPRG